MGKMGEFQRDQRWVQVPREGPAPGSLLGRVLEGGGGRHGGGVQGKLLGHTSLYQSSCTDLSTCQKVTRPFLSISAQLSLKAMVAHKSILRRINKAGGITLLISNTKFQSSKQYGTGMKTYTSMEQNREP